MASKVSFALYDASATPLVGVVPTFVHYMDRLGNARAQPVIVEIGGGLYGFQPTTADEMAGTVFLIDSGSVLAAPRYHSGAIYAAGSNFLAWHLELDGVLWTGAAPTVGIWRDFSGGALPSPTITSHTTYLFSITPSVTALQGTAYRIDSPLTAEPPYITGWTESTAAVIYNPVLADAEASAIDAVRALELPIPSTLTRIVGIHQSDIIIRSAIVAALADLRANPFLLNYVFASLPQDTLTWKEYGEKDLQQARNWFLRTNIPVSVLPRFDESKFPQITIELVESAEVAPEATLGDVNYETGENSTDNSTTWPVLSSKFTPASYDMETGTVVLPSEPDGISIFAGMYLVDRKGRSHEIHDVTSQSEFSIAPGTIADFRGSVLKGANPGWKVSVESSSFKESYRIGIHVQGEPAHLSWLHSIVQFALLRYKQVLMEGRGFERSTFSSSQISRAEWSEAENVYSRYITITGHVRQFWPKTITQAIDGVQLDGLQVGGVGGATVMVEGSGVDPDDALWIGNLDALRTRG
jgi:hypothetical protein